MSFNMRTFIIYAQSNLNIIICSLIEILLLKYYVTTSHITFCFSSMERGTKVKRNY